MCRESVELPFVGIETAEVAQDCRQVTSRRAAVEDDPCYELFRRAFVENDQRAWQCLHAQYHALICSWIQHAAPNRYNREETSDLANRVFTKFWYTLHDSAVPFHERFAYTPQLITYLNRCTTSLLYDEGRKLQRAERRVDWLQSQQPETVVSDHALDDAIDRACTLERVRQWVQTQVDDPLERLVLQLTFNALMSPKEIVAACPDEFPDTRTVRRIKERVIKRARRYLEN